MANQNDGATQLGGITVTGKRPGGKEGGGSQGRGKRGKGGGGGKGPTGDEKVFTFTQGMYDFTKGNETVNDHPDIAPYLDTKGKVTIGIGHMIPSEDAFALEPLIVTATKAPATEQEKRDAYRKLQKEPKGKLAGSYAPVTGLEMAESDIYKYFKDDLEAAKLAISTFIGAKTFNSMPSQIREALVDLSFQLGPNRIKSFTSLQKAVQNRDYKGIKNEIHIIDKDKNGKTIEGLERRNEARQGKVQEAIDDKEKKDKKDRKEKEKRRH